jgi:hypothetical protein
MHRFVTMLLLTFALSLVAGCFSRSTDPVSGQDKKSRLGESKDSGNKGGGKGKTSNHKPGAVPMD